MSEPVNHHYVSRCHIKQFYNEEKKHIYLYDKKLRNFYKKQGTKRVFSEDNLNTRLLRSGIDKISMEIELQVMFEENFAKHLDAVKKFYNDHTLIEKAYEDLNYLALMALIGEYRNPHYKQGLGKTLDSMKDHAKSLGVVVRDEDTHREVKYQNIKGYIDIASLLLKTMDPITFAIVEIKSNDHFILPDTSGFLVREHLEIGKVVQFGLPISDKLFILGRSASMGRYPTSLVKTTVDDDGLIFKINSDLVNYAYQTVACSDEAFLRKTLTRMEKVGFIGQYFHGCTIGSKATKKKEKTSQPRA